MSYPKQTLEQMAVLRDRLSQPLYQKYMEFFQVSTMTGQIKHSIAVTDSQGRASGKMFCDRERQRLDMAEAYFVSKDMTALVDWSSKSLDETDTFRHDLWPTDYGFVWFEEPLLSLEARGRTMTLKAMTWGRVTQNGRHGTYLVTYSDGGDPRDEVSVHLTEQGSNHIEVVGRLQVSHMAFIEDGAKVGPATYDPAQDTRIEDYGPLSALPLASQAENGNRHILALLMLLNQTVASVTREPADRQTAKRMKRMNLPGEVTVVQLRRSEGSRQEGESLVAWSHRWIVRGFWRWQPYGKRADDHTHAMGEVWSEGGRMVRLCEAAGCDRHWERIYVAPFCKGPEGLPFKQSTKVYSLSR